MGKRSLHFAVCFLLVIEGQAAWADTVTRTYSMEAKDPRLRLSSFQNSPRTFYDSKRGTLRLAHSMLLADEEGGTDYRQTERLSDRVHVKKIFTLQDPHVGAAELFFFGRAKQIVVNGERLPPAKTLFSTGWSRLSVPAKLLRGGRNEFLFQDGGQLLLEPGRPGTSYKSVDGGKTWSRRSLTTNADQQGEYLIRLRVAQYPDEGHVYSPVLDLWRVRRDDIPSPAKISSFDGLAHLNKTQPAGTQITAWLRLGSTAFPDKTWTAWQPLRKKYQLSTTSQQHRWGQLKFTLTTTDAQTTPSLGPKFNLKYDLQPLASPNNDKLVLLQQAPPVLRSSLRFTYQRPSPRLKLLREHYKLDQVIAPGKTEFEKLQLLRHWVRNQWHTAWGNHPAQWMPPWDALIILKCKDQPDCLTMCTHYAAVYTQCCLALGWNARHCILDHHCVAEVYVQQFDKWVMMDAGNSAQRADVNLHFERNGIPMSARELHLAYHRNDTKDIQVRFTSKKMMDKIAPLCRPAPPSKKKYPPRPDVIPLAELKNYPVCLLNNYRRYAFPARNNYLKSLLPGELYQGWSQYFYDGYQWVGDSSDGPTLSPEYTRHTAPDPAREADWKLNWTRIYLARTKRQGQLQVHLESLTPNLARFEKHFSSANKNFPCRPSFTWNLQPGVNELTVWSVNAWGRKGTPTSVRVKYEK